jgi:choline monooxygenase
MDIRHCRFEQNNKPIAALYYWIFPNTMLNFYPWGLSVNIVKPITPQLTRVSFLSFTYPNSNATSHVNALDKVEREDEAIVESVQKGINSRFYTHGRYATKRETGTHHFHQLLAHFINN